jgi:hypothetical protein
MWQGISGAGARLNVFGPILKPASEGNEKSGYSTMYWWAVLGSNQ